MKKYMWLLAIPIVILVLFAIRTLSIKKNQVDTESVESVSEAPDFTLPALDGKPFRFSNQRGKVIILDFWATWCPPCRAELPHFKSLYEQYNQKGLQIVGVALDDGGAEVVRPFVEDNDIKYPILIGNQEVVEDYGGIRGIPTTFVVDRKGHIIKKFVGYQDKEVFESAIKELL
jgi:cytochrome c biogenesis protein CcmG/thiol:disulfide interchange protein DsbE